MEAITCRSERAGLLRPDFLDILTPSAVRFRPTCNYTGSVKTTPPFGCNEPNGGVVNEELLEQTGRVDRGTIAQCLKVQVATRRVPGGTGITDDLTLRDLLARTDDVTGHVVILGGQ